MMKALSLRSLVSLMAAGALTLSLAACSSGTGAPSSASPGPAESAGGESAPEAKGGVATFDLFVNMTWFPTDEWTGIIPETITERTGVAMNVTRAVDNQQLGLMIASNELPDLIFTDAELSRLSSPQFAYSYKELIEQYTPDWQPDKMQITNSLMYSTDDNYYFLLTAFATSEQWAKAKGVGNVPSIGIRDDIYEAVGSPKLQTLDDFTALLGMVKGQYPELIPYVSSEITTWGNKALRTWFGISDGDFCEVDGKVVHYTSHPKYKEYLQYVNNFYRQGYMTADNYSLSGTDITALFTNGQAFSASGCTDGKFYSYGEMAKKTDPNARVREISLMPPDARIYSSGTGWAGVVISKNCHDPETAIKFMQYMFTEEGMRLSMWGREGVEWTMGGDGLPVFNGEWLQASQDQDVFNAKYNPNYYISVNAIVDTEGRVAALPEDYRAIYGEIAKHIYACPWIGAATPKSEGEEKVIHTKISDLVRNSEVKCFLAESDEEFEKNYAEMMDNARQVGVERLEAYMNEKVTELRPLYE